MQRPSDLERRSAVEAISALARKGSFAEAHALADRCLEAMPGDTAVLFAKASALLDCGRFAESRATYEEAQRQGLDSAQLYRQLGWACFQGGASQDAVAYLTKAIDADPGSFESHFCLGLVLEAQARYDDAVVALRHAVQLAPRDFQALLELGKCALENDSYSAELHLRDALKVRPEDPAAWSNLGFALARQDRHVDSIRAFEKAYALDTRPDDNIDAFANLAVAYAGEGRLADACAVLHDSLRSRPSPFAHFNYALALLAEGRLAEAWPHHEFRLLMEPHVSNRPPYAKPVWSGQDIDGKSVLIRTEQGVGDMIQFLRYVPMLKAKGANVLLKVAKELEVLAGSVRGVDRVLPVHETPLDFDFYIHALSLPGAFATDLESIPHSVPYIVADATRKARWAQQLAGLRARLRVGLVWAGNPKHQRDRYRSIDFGMLQPLFSVPDVRFVLLQKGNPAVDVASITSVQEPLDLGPELADFADTAAVIDELDLVIGVDTAVIHLAGALGKPVWTLLPKPCDWRWLHERDDSPWYPSMRLFRQRVRGDWTFPIDAAAEALRLCVASASHITAPSIAPSSDTGRVATEVGAAPVPTRPSSETTLQAAQSRFAAVAEGRYGVLQYRPGRSLVEQSIEWFGEFAQRHVRMLERVVRAGATVVEVGAGVGAHVLPLSAAVGPSGRVIAFERDDVTRRMLRQNIQANRLNNVTVLPSLGGGQPQAAVPATMAAAPEAAASTDSIDSLRFDGIELLKVAYGSDATEVVRGAEETLWRARPLLFLHISDAPSSAPIADDVKQFGYRCWRVDAPLFDVDNFNRQDRDLLQGVVAYALLAFPEERDVGASLDGCPEL